MIPHPGLQLQVAIRALRDVVAPSVDPSDRVAVEQLHLSIATIELVRGRLGVIEPLRRAEIREAVDLGEQLCALAPETEDAHVLGDVITRARSAMGDFDTSSEDLEELLRELQAANCALVENCDHVGRDVAVAVTKAAKPQIERARAWCLPAGFETDPTAIGQIEDHLPRRAQHPKRAERGSC
jgi:hypothetical protein